MRHFLHALRSKKTTWRIGSPSTSCTRLIVLQVLFVILLAACGGSNPSGAVAELEVKLTQEAQPTASGVTTSAAEQGQESSPDESVADAAGEASADGESVAQPTLDSVLQTAGATATVRAMELEATSVAAAQVNAASQAATSEAMTPILEELASLGVDPNEGELAFAHPPISLEVSDFESSDFANRFAFTVAQDFVMAADITWSSRFAESGCGFAVRADGDEEAPNQYIVGVTRGAEGHVLFAEQLDGEVDLSDVTDIYANGIDPLFEWQSGTTNRIVVVGRGQDFTIFSNGTRLGTITGKAGFEEGFVAFIAVNRSGGIRCDYNNAWLWKIN